MNKLLIGTSFVIGLLALQGCSQSADPVPSAGAAAPTVTAAAEPAPVRKKSVGEQAVEVVQSSPEQARKFAKSSPESVALESAKAARLLASGTVVSESAAAKVAALADLAAYASEVAPGSAVIKTAAEQARADANLVKQGSGKQGDATQGDVAQGDDAQQ